MRQLSCAAPQPDRPMPLDQYFRCTWGQASPLACVLVGRNPGCHSLTKTNQRRLTPASLGTAVPSILVGAGSVMPDDSEVNTVDVDPSLQGPDFVAVVSVDDFATFGALL